MKISLTVIATAALIALASAAMSGPMVTQVTTNAYEDSFPQIKGNYVVWQGNVDGDWEIFVYDMVTKETTRLTSNDDHDLSPQTDGEHVVWQGMSSGGWDIFLWDGLEIQNISDPVADDTSPQIANGLVVWTSQPAGDDDCGDIILYDIENGTRSVLSAQVDPGNAFDDTSPRIDVNVVCWLQTDDQDNVRLFVYGIHDGTVKEDTGYLSPGNPQVDGNLTVLTRHDGTDREIFLYNSTPRHHHQITDNDIDDEFPGLSGNRAAWVAHGEIFVAEYHCLNLVCPRHDGCCNVSSPPTFMWEAIGYSELRIEFSEDPGFSGRGTRAFPDGTGQFLTGESFTPSRAEWWSILGRTARGGDLYWRIAGSHSEGNVEYSEVRHLTVERAKPSYRKPFPRLRPTRAF